MILLTPDHENGAVDSRQIRISVLRDGVHAEAGVGDGLKGRGHTVDTFERQRAFDHLEGYRIAVRHQHLQHRLHRAPAIRCDELIDKVAVDLVAQPHRRNKRQRLDVEIGHSRQTQRNPPAQRMTDQICPVRRDGSDRVGQCRGHRGDIDTFARALGTAMGRQVDGVHIAPVGQRLLIEHP